jgi:hypothetical protein
MNFVTVLTLKHDTILTQSPFLLEINEYVETLIKGDLYFHKILNFQTVLVDELFFCYRYD